jgi:hypothetical protein
LYLCNQTTTLTACFRSLYITDIISKHMGLERWPETDILLRPIITTYNQNRALNKNISWDMLRKWNFKSIRLHPPRQVHVNYGTWISNNFILKLF